MQSIPVLAFLLASVWSPPGEKLPKGPPWHTEYRTAKREALRLGKPVYVYFTKTY